MNLSNGKIALISIGVLVAVMLFSAYRIEPNLGIENNSLVIFEDKIVKKQALSVLPGESYTYSYKAFNDSTNATYDIEDGGSCTILSFQGTGASICIDRYGNEKSQQNSTYPVPIIMFKPWMLAVDYPWRWNVSSHLTFEGFERSVESVTYETKRRELYKGRDAFVVKISSSLGQEVWDWVDADKRVLLREVGPDYELELVSGLPMDQS